jgi:hypothetical protein
MISCEEDRGSGEIHAIDTEHGERRRHWCKRPDGVRLRLGGKCYVGAKSKVWRGALM